MINTCDECNKETRLQLYPFGYWYYDNNGGHHNIGEETNICNTCLKEKE
tara:strand:- start:254 stop:400 length:147 start_codon:yes stop_codon:yes gene_type:complete